MASRRLVSLLAAAVPAAALPLLATLAAPTAGCATDPSADPACTGGKCDDLGEPDRAISVVTDTVTVFRSYDIEQPSEGNQFTTRYRGAERHEYHLKVLRIRNAAGLELSFVVGGGQAAPDRGGDGAELCGETSCAGAGRAPYGARLYQADLRRGSGTQPLLYRNGDGLISETWGPLRLDDNRQRVGWLGLGGAESAFPTDEHGFYAATDWDYRWQRNPDGSVTFTSSTATDPNHDGTQALDVAMSYTVPVAATYWRNRIELKNPSASATTSYQYWHNYMLPAGANNDRHRVEVLIPDIGKIQVHSTGDDDLKSSTTGVDPGILPDGGHAPRLWRDGLKETFVHGPVDAASASKNVQTWLGFFSLDGAVERYGFYDHASEVGLGIHAAPDGDSIPTANLIFPKGFGGPGIHPDSWTRDGSRYVEMWYSINTPDFWTSTSLAPGATKVNETLVFPFLDRAGFDGFDPFAPDRYRVGGDAPVEPEPTGAALTAWQPWRERNQSSIASDAEGHGVVRIVGSGGDGFNGGGFSRVCGLAGATLGVTASVSEVSSQWTEVIALTDGRAPADGADVTGSQAAAAGIALGGAEQVVTPSGDCVTLVVKTGTTRAGATEGATFRLAVRRR